VISSVVPPGFGPPGVCERYFSLKPLFIEPVVRTGCPCSTQPRRRGADRIVTPIAAVASTGHRHQSSISSTATTFDCGIRESPVRRRGHRAPDSEFQPRRVREDALLAACRHSKPARFIGSEQHVASFKSLPLYTTV